MATVWRGSSTLGSYLISRPILWVRIPHRSRKIEHTSYPPNEWIDRRIGPHTSKETFSIESLGFKARWQTCSFFCEPPHIRLNLRITARIRALEGNIPQAKFEWTTRLGMHILLIILIVRSLLYYAYATKARNICQSASKGTIFLHQDTICTEVFCFHSADSVSPDWSIGYWLLSSH